MGRTPWSARLPLEPLFRKPRSLRVQPRSRGNRLLTRAARQCAFDRAATVRERLRTFETFGHLIVSRPLSPGLSHLPKPIDLSNLPLTQTELQRAQHSPRLLGGTH